MDNKLTMVVSVCALILSVAAILRKPQKKHECKWKTFAVVDVNVRMPYWTVAGKVAEMHHQECEICGDRKSVELRTVPY